MRVVQLKFRQILRLSMFLAFAGCLVYIFVRIMQPVSRRSTSENVVAVADVLPKPKIPNDEDKLQPLLVKSEDIDKIPFPKHKLGPQAVFRDGVTGNYEPPIVMVTGPGPGEGGKAVHISLEEKDEADRQTREYGFNMVASDKMAMNRSIPDTRMPECQFWHYPEELPTASVILVFFNEGWSTLVRTIHSIINTSPKANLKEVVLIDDGSDYDFLGKKLEDYIKQWNGLVKLFRNPERYGLITARTNGAKHSSGDVIVFLDAHCECNKNWLPPLLTRIKHDRTIMAVPIVDGINWDTMAYYPVYDEHHHRGIFEWGFLYKEGLVPQKVLDKREHPSEPYASPTHAGGLLAMDKSYFFELGAYDPGLKIWGGENYELAFKVWMCGGSSEWVPCSRVGHIYRGPRSGGAPKKRQAEPKVPHSFANYLRVVNVWMEGEFKEFFYTREPWLRGAPYGDISEQLKMKKEKKCKSFAWFMENVAYDVYDKFPKLPPNVAWGEIKNHMSRTKRLLLKEKGRKLSLEEERAIRNQKKYERLTKPSNLCMDSRPEPRAPVTLYPCNKARHSQLFRLNAKGQLGLGERCIMEKNHDTLHIAVCDTQPEGPWAFDKEIGQIKHTKLNKCIGTSKDNKLHLYACNHNDIGQQWEINEIYPWKK